MSRERHMIWMGKGGLLDGVDEKRLPSQGTPTYIKARQIWEKQSIVKKWIFCLVLLLLPYCVLTSKQNRHGQVFLGRERKGEVQDGISPSLNRTLGFEKVYVLNVQRRVDRRNMMSLMALASNIDIEYIDAVDAEAVTKLRLPPINLLDGLQKINFEFTPGQLGCYRSNLNIMQKIIDERVTSALIIQDDVEWDVDLFSALERVQAPLRNLISLEAEGKPLKASESHPWSDQAWDIFWLGASYEHPWPDADSAPYVLYEDPTVAYQNLSEAGGARVFPHYGIDRATNEEGPFQRLVQKSRQPLGMAAYAVTLPGAAKILSRAGQQITQPYDSTICSMSRPNDPVGYRTLGCVIADPIKGPGESEMRSYSVWPPLFSQFRNAEGVRDSDLHSNRPKGFKVEGVVGYALEIKDGVREKIMSQKWKWN